MHARMKARHVLLALYAVLCLAALTWPGHAFLGATLGHERAILGLPPWFAWVVAWVVTTFGVLVLFQRTDEA